MNGDQKQLPQTAWGAWELGQEIFRFHQIIEKLKEEIVETEKHINEIYGRMRRHEDDE